MEQVMSVLDGVSLVLAVGLFIYLLVALLRAEQA
jgi:K+-transporting ATPase ATPase F chain